MRYPPARRQDLREQVAGQWVSDPYRWLEDAEAPETTAWLAAQDQLARKTLDSYPGRDALAARLRTLLRTGREGPPTPRGDLGFRLRRAPHQQHAAVVVGPLADPESFRTLVDPFELDPSGSTTLDACQPSPDGKLLAYQVSSGGDEESSLWVMDVETGARVEGPIDRTRYSPVAWLPSGDEFYYVRRLRMDSPFDRRVYLHRVGTDPEADDYVFGEGSDPRTYFDVDVCPSGRWLVISAAIGTAPRNDVWVASLSNSLSDSVSGPDFQVVQAGVDARCSAAVAFDGRLYIWTDAAAPRGRLCVADPADPARWSTLVAEDGEAVLADYAVLASEVIVSRSRHAVSEVTAVDRLTGETLREIPLPGIGSVLGLTAPPDGGSQAWIGYTDATTPPGVIDAQGTLWAAAPGADEVSPAQVRIQVSVEECTSADGTPIRLHLLTQGSPPADSDRGRPTVLYGYGGFGISMEPAYSPAALAWAEAGGVWAVALLRGGGEEGEAWHRAGMREHKQNVFADFEAAARHLRATGRASRLAIFGGSNGGLLVGAALTRQPELYDAVVCSAPLLDMMRYEQFGLGSTWNDEYGTAADPVEAGWLLSYSPVHAVKPGGTYPPVLLEVFDSDSRVDPFHARKFAAALQHAGSRNPASASVVGAGLVLLRREADVGHAARSIDRTIALSVDNLSFLAAQLQLMLSG